MLRLGSLSAVGSVLLLLAGCGADSTGGGGSGGGGTASTSSATGAGGQNIHAFIDDLCNLTGSLFCDAYFTCCGDIKDLGKTIEECKHNQTGSVCLWRQIEADLAAGNATFDQTQMDACVAQLKEITAGGAACRSAKVVNQTVCAGAFQGKLLPGEACTGDDGNPITFWKCHEGRCMHGKCVPFGKVGDACIVDQGPIESGDCNYVKGEWCMGPALGAPGVCAPQRGLGAPCDPVNLYDYECKSLHCDEMLLQCVPATPPNTACTWW